MQIRRLDPSDVGRLLALWREADLPFRPNGRDRSDRVTRELGGAQSAYFGAEEDGELVGVVLATHDGRKGWINRLAVAAQARRRGVGTALVTAAEEWLAGRGVLILTCLIERDNSASLSLFDALGYARHDEIAYLAKRLDPEA